MLKFFQNLYSNYQSHLPRFTESVRKAVHFQITTSKAFCSNKREHLDNSSSGMHMNSSGSMRTGNHNILTRLSSDLFRCLWDPRFPQALLVFESALARARDELMQQQKCWWQRIEAPGRRILLTLSLNEYLNLLHSRICCWTFWNSF